MNKLIFRKLYFDIFTFFILSTLSITSIIWVIQGVNLLDIVTEQGHSFKIYFIYSVYRSAILSICSTNLEPDNFMEVSKSICLFFKPSSI